MSQRGIRQMTKRLMAKGIGLKHQTIDKNKNKNK